MGIFTINVGEISVLPYTIVSQDINDCFSEVRITVNHNGSDKYVNITSVGDGVNPNFDIDEVITANKTYTLFVDGYNRDPQKNNTKGTVTLAIREGSSVGEGVAIYRLERIHSGNYC